MSLNRLSEGVSAAAGFEATDRRAAALREEQERIALRHAQIEAQSSPHMTARERIGLWENLHALQLPRGAEHKLVRVIAKQTGLTVHDVQAEQLRRANPSGIAPE